MQFEYVVRDNEGRRQEGILDGEDQRAVVRALQDRGDFVLSVDPVRPDRESIDWGLVGYALRPVSPRSFAVFYRSFESCLHAGMTVFDAFTRMERDTADPRLKAALRDLASRVGHGEQLAAATGQHPDCFPKHVRELLRAGEENGCLEEMVGEVAAGYETDDRISRSLRWPIGFLALTLLPLPIFWRAFNYFEYLAAFWITPERMPAYEGSPWSAAMGWWLRHDAPMCALMTVLVALALVAGRVIVRYPGRLRWRDALGLRLPLWGTLARSCAQVRLLRAIRAAYRAGQPFAEALHMGMNASGNAVFEDRLEPQVSAVREGRKLAEGLRAADVLPRTAVSGIAQGEDTGTLEESLQRATEYLERDHEDTIRAALFRSWFVAIFYALAAGMLASAHFYNQYFKWVFDFTEHLFD